MKNILILLLSVLSFSAFAQWLPNGSTTGDIYYNNGNVGIGTGATPTRKLHVSVPASSLQLRLERTGEGASVSDIGCDNIGLRFFPGGYAGSMIPKVMFSNNGNVGIGSGNPVTWFNSTPTLHMNGNRPTISLTPTIANGLATIQFKGASTNSEFHLNFQDGAESLLSLTSYQFPNNQIMNIKGNGEIGIGTNKTAGFALSVNGKIRAREVQIYSSWADFVFEPDYNLMSLEQVDSYIRLNRHLPEVPTAEEVEKNGINLGEINATLLRKIEELTLYIIEQDKKQKALEERLLKLEGK